MLKHLMNPNLLFEVNLKTSFTRSVMNRFTQAVTSSKFPQIDHTFL